MTQLRRVLGFRDLLLFYIVTSFSLRWVATAAAAGPSALVIWIIAALGLYLYGWPSAQLVQQFAPGGPLHNMAWATLLALALAAASWFLVERPALRLKRRLVTPKPENGKPEMGSE